MANDFYGRKEDPNEVANREIIAKQKCIIPREDHDGEIVMHHYPGRSYQKADNGLLNVVPICWHHHQLWHNGDKLIKALVAQHAMKWWKYALTHYPNEYLGPMSRVRYVQGAQ